MARTPWHKHYLKRNHACQRPTEYVFVDVETSQETVDSRNPYVKHTLKLGVACHVTWKKGREPVEQWFNFDYATHFWAWLAKLQRKRSVLWVVAHNAQFDLTILGFWEKLENGEYSTNRVGRTYRDARTGVARVSDDWHGLLAIDGTPFHVETVGSSGRCNFTDLQNFYPCSLEEVGRTVGVVKGSWDQVKGDAADLRAYCHQDVEILKRAYLNLVKEWEKKDNGNWQFSAAGLANSHFRHCYLKHDIAIHNHSVGLQTEFDSLYGGEVRCWFRGSVDSGVVHVDVNSLYPSVMLDNVFPTALVDVVSNVKSSTFRRLVEQYASVARVTLQTAVDHYPVRVGNRIEYPIGRFTTTLAGPELMRALERGHIVHCDFLALYTYAPIFRTYVLDWWEIKRAATAAGREAEVKFAKLMLNSLPAKFAQRTPQWTDEPRVDVVRPWRTFPWKCPDTGTIYPARSVGWIGQVCRQRKAAENAFPAIYAYVTSYARERMRCLRSVVPPSHLLYQDTDSMMVTKESFNSGEMASWVIGDGLGQLRIVGNYDTAHFRGVKNYTVDGRHVIAGIRKRDEEIAPLHFVGTRFERSSHLFTRGPNGTINEVPVAIDSSAKPNEGYVRDDGFVKPVIMPSDIPASLLASFPGNSCPTSNPP